MRKKLPALHDALVGRFDDHHGFLATTILRHIDDINTMVAELDQRIMTEIEPYQQEIALLDTIPGISHGAAEVIIAEIGASMDRYITARHLASWAGVRPGNNKTGGKAKPDHTRPGNKWLKAALGIAALSAVRSKDSYINAQFRRIAARHGGKRAASAIAHTLLTAIWHIRQRQTPYHDLGADYFLNHTDPDRQRRRAIAQLERLGYTVAIQASPA